MLCGCGLLWRVVARGLVYGISVFRVWTFTGHSALRSCGLVWNWRAIFIEV